MLRINLLPPYIYDKQKKLKWIVGSIALIPITLGIMLWYSALAQAEVAKATARKSEAQTQQDQYNKHQQDIKKEEDAVAATKKKEDFIASAIKYNASWPRVYTAMRDLTSPKVLLKTMYVSDDHKSLNFTGFCANEEDLVRWWMFLRSQSSLYQPVHFQLPSHGYKPDAPAASSAGRAGGSSGAPPLAAMGGSMSMSAGGSGGRGGGGSFGGGGGNSSAVGDEEIEGRKGISFTAFAVLKEPLAGGIPTPTWGGGGGSSSGSSSGGMSPMGSGGSMMPMGASAGR